MMQAEDTSQKRRDTIKNPPLINNDDNQAIGRSQRTYEIKKKINNGDTVTKYIEARRQVKNQRVIFIFVTFQHSCREQFF